MAKARALLLSNWEYNDPNESFKPLQGPASNLEVMEKVLTHPKFGLFDSHVEAHGNLTAASMGDKLLQFINSAESDDHLLIYYSGHGERLEMQQLGLCGIDVTEATLENRCFDTKRLRDWLNSKGRARSTMIVLDCCYAGQFMSSPSDAVLTDSFGEGIAVITSGGNVPVRDARTKDTPSPFTEALASVLVDETLPGSEGRLSPEDAYQALLKFNLVPRPHRKLSGSGLLSLAKRDPQSPRQPLTESELRGWVERSFETVDVLFDRAVVRSVWPGGDAERDLAALDPARLLAIRRMLQLLDVVVGTPDLRAAGFYPVRRAWHCIGMNLLENTLPESLKERLASGTDTSGEILRLRLHFGDAAADLARYPWEYICGGNTDVELREGFREPPLPLGLRRKILIERVGRKARTVSRANRGVSSSTVDNRGARTKPDVPPQLSSSTQPDPATAPAKTRTTTVGLVNGLDFRYHQLGERICRELGALSSTDLVFDLGSQGKDPADWATFTDSLDQTPDHLVLLLPTQRTRDLRLGFTGAPDWRTVDEVSRLLVNKKGIKLVVLGTVAAPPSTDAFRGSIEAAGKISATLGKPVIFYCHTPGFENFVQTGVDDPRPMTFTGLLLHALSLGKDPEQAFVYARDRVVGMMSDELRPLFGVPGYYLPARGVPSWINASEAPSPEAS